MAFLDKLKYGCTLLGVVLIALGIYSAVKYNSVPVPLDNINALNIKNGEMVEGSIVMNFGCYEESYNTHYGIPDKNSLVYYYIIPIDDKYMGISAHAGEQGGIFDIQTAKTFDWLNNPNMPEPSPIQVKGVVSNMTSEDQGYFKQALIEGGYSASEAESLIVPYYIKRDAYSDYALNIIIGVVSLIIGIGSFVIVKIRG